jgi:rare lipoprotein A
MRAILAALILCVCAAAAHAEVASWYGAESGNRTASGERFVPGRMTAAHRTLPFSTLVRVTCRGRSVVVRANDRSRKHRSCRVFALGSMDLKRAMAINLRRERHTRELT